MLISSRPDGRGLSAKVTLPEGSVDNSGKLIADAGTIAMHAQTVNQGGLVQANSIREVNGVVEIVASDSINLGANSVLSARGDSQGASPGGIITVKSANNFTDQPGSTINFSGGAQGGNGGQAEISAASVSAIQSRTDAHAISGFRGGRLTLDPYDLTLDAAFVSSLTPVLNGGLSEITLQADHNITLATRWTLNDSSSPAELALTAGNNITLNSGSAIIAGNNWGVTLSAGPHNLAARPAGGSDGIYLQGNSYIKTRNGDIDVWAANEVIVNPGPPYKLASGDAGNNGIRTLNGGNISVTAQFGDVNTGGNYQGYVFQQFAPYYSVSPNLGGISTLAGGNVNIAAGGNVTSYLPVQGDYDHAQYDGGTGAFGGQPGNVTITAGGNVSGHYVVANGIGSVTAGKNIGAATSSGGFALSLVKGSWSVYAPNGTIYVQDIRNPNGVFNDLASVAESAGFHRFDYDPDATVLLQSANSVEITGAGAPHAGNESGYVVPFLFPPTLRVTTGAGGFVLDTDVILFPSPHGELNIFTTHGGDFRSYEDPTLGELAAYTLSMSDSGASQWDPFPDGTFGSFLAQDHASTPPELNNHNPAVVFVSGSVKNINLRTTKVTQMQVGGDMFNASFLGENLHPDDLTSIHVGGNVSYSPLYTFATLTDPVASADPQNPGAWDSIFSFLVDPNAPLRATPDVVVMSPKQQTAYAYSHLRLTLRDSYILQAGYDVNANPGFVYDANSQQLGYKYRMTETVRNALAKDKITVFQRDALGNVVIEKRADGNYYFATTTASFVPASTLDKLYTQSLSSIKNEQGTSAGFQLGGPGRFEINAASLDLGSSAGIISWGICSSYNPINYGYLAPLTFSGASVRVEVTGDITLLTSTIASIFGGDVAVSSGGSVALSLGDFAFIPPGANISYGIFTSGHSDVAVNAESDINVGGARIATFNGGNVSIRSEHGTVNAGNGANSILVVPIIYRDPATGLLASGQIQGPRPFGSGVLAISPTERWQTGGGNPLPGDITIETPYGDIISTLGGIQQFALNGSVAGGPKITLTAGTKPSVLSPGYAGNVDLGSGGIIGGTINISAEGSVKGLIVSRQDANITAAQSFSGTLLSGGTANVSATAGTVSGTVIGIGGVSASGGSGVTAAVMGQNVSIGGGEAQSTLGKTAAATTVGTAAAGLANAETKQLAQDTTQEDDQKKKQAPPPALVKRVGRVTVMLPPA